jgi:hypothetical protein
MSGSNRNRITRRPALQKTTASKGGLAYQHQLARHKNSSATFCAEAYYSLMHLGRSMETFLYFALLL